MGFGHSSNLHHLILRLSQDLALVIEIVDSEKAINRLIDAIGVMGAQLVTTKKVKVIQYGTKLVE